MTVPAVWEQLFEVRAYEVDPRGGLTAHALCDWLQEVAGRHAHALGWAVHELGERGLTWVLSRLHLRLESRPGWGSTVRLETWPVGIQRAFAVRDFRAVDGAGTGVAAATSGWLLLNLASRRPVRPPAELETLAAASPARALADDFAKLPSAADGEPVARFTARFSDLDVNRHVNNAALLRMVLDGVPDGIGDSHSPAELEIEYRAEVLLGDVLEARVEAVDQGQGRILHSLVRAADGREVARARTRWAESGPG